MFNSNLARTGRNDLDDSAKISNVLPGGGTFVVIWNLYKINNKKKKRKNINFISYKLSRNTPKQTRII